MRFTKLLAPISGALAVTVLTGSSLAAPSAKTPIQHVVVIFQENVSFDHYFGTYPVAKNTDGTKFTADPSTPSVNALTNALLTANPNFNPVTKLGNPFRLSASQAATCDQDHDYGDEQAMFDAGMMDNFVAFNTGTSSPFCAPAAGFNGDLNAGHPDDLIMGYYDGNTVTALWNYAQNFAMNDSSFGTTFGPSSPGAINLVSGYTAGATQTSGTGDVTAGSLTNDAQPNGDACTTRDSATMSGKNIGDRLNDAGLSWGFFEGGFDLTITNTDPTTGVQTTACHRAHTSLTKGFTPKVDYIPHHEPFQYYSSTANPTHKRPSSVSAIGGSNDGGVNHQYDSHDFFDALNAGNLPNVVFLKAPGYQDGHAGYSSPLDEQVFSVDTINQLQKSKFWNSTAVLILYDDSDGWYDHQMGPIIMHSQSDGAAGVNPADSLTGPNQCGSATLGMQGPGRCGYGPRLPFLVISPWAKTNFVDHTVTDQTSAIAFIEQNCGLPVVTPATDTDPGSYDQYAGPITSMFDFTQKKGAVNSHKLFLDPVTGAVLKKAPKGDDGGNEP